MVIVETGAAAEWPIVAVVDPGDHIASGDVLVVGDRTAVIQPDASRKARKAEVAR